MRELKQLTPIELETLKRLAEEFSLQTLAEHTTLSTRALNHAIEEGANGIRADHHTVITEYLRAHV